ncbi:MAG: DUF3990 domain-containing protein [Erysipelotrichaceae bacterium]|nr:DUF3990 domain-containing protein [Erysipelotrichaceae bacterium]MBR2827009.1 DUF3990 domain-containing protein [Erysipelotrichaceae bacterium]MBR3352882.1 DUF3990 domain-containing protein [Erysipelotrichaceae bacterium]
MILYHTSDQIIRDPDIHHGRKNADFGWGFYLTPGREFTYRWARENAVVNEYEFDESGLDVYCFKRSVEWFEYIFHNRRLQDTIDADVIIGPIANDTIFDTLGIITSCFLTSEQALKLLMVGLEYTQVAIKTEKAKRNLRWLRAERIERADAQILKKEQEEFQKAFGEQLERI